MSAVHLEVAMDCPKCQGEGYQLVGEGYPGEHPVRCNRCNGEGTLEACATCGETPTVKAGLEVCACTGMQVAA